MEPKGHYPYQAPIDAYGDGGFRFAEMSHRGSLLCLSSGMHAWAAVTVSDLTPEVFAPVLAAADEIDVLFVGMGETIAPLPKAVRDVLKAHNIMVEAIATGSAISIYNILLAEKRAVGAALLAVERAGRER